MPFVAFVSNLCKETKNFSSCTVFELSIVLILLLFLLQIWNEKDCNYDYILTLRKTLNDNKLQNVQIIACDGWWDGFGSLAQNKTLMDSILAFG